MDVESLGLHSCILEIRRQVFWKLSHFPHPTNGLCEYNYGSYLVDFQLLKSEPFSHSQADAFREDLKRNDQEQ